MYLEMHHGDGSYEERQDCRRRMYQLSEVCKLVSERKWHFRSRYGVLIGVGVTCATIMVSQLLIAGNLAKRENGRFSEKNGRK